MANGFETTLSFDVGFGVISEPLPMLVQESLAQIGIKATINKIPGATLRKELTEESAAALSPMCSGAGSTIPSISSSGAITARTSIFNTMSYQDRDMDALIDGAGEAAAYGDDCEIRKDVKGFIDLAFVEVPRIPLFQPYLERRDAEERLRLSLLVPPPARLSSAREGVTATKKAL